MSPAAPHEPSRPSLTSEHPQDNTTERHLRDLREAADGRDTAAKRPHESPATGVDATTKGLPSPEQ
ncbi:hypothetical protein [Baekduia sp. Peel2402]|uniref:hypothetical protein n=1 Tax=Baekduia sp. Peel2402 TaxID=3458296 RepID=UPI00403E3EB5